MKKIISILLLNLPYFIYAQERDKVSLIIQYDYKSVKDTSNMDKKSQDFLQLEVGKHISKFYSINTFRVDSAIKAEESSGNSNVANAFSNVLKVGKRGELYTIYQNYPTKSITVIDRIVKDVYKYDEPFAELNWKILPDTMTIIGYKVQKATCVFGDRVYEAWYSADIPVDKGPWKLHGLPGLILKANDKQNYFTFTAVGISVPKVPISLMADLGDKKIVTDKDIFLLQQEKFLKNPLGALNNSGVRVDTSKLPFTTKPYNMIERPIHK